MDIFATEVMERNEYFPKANFETLTSSETFSTPIRKKKRKSNSSMNKRRFSDEQVRSLESIFYSSDSKLDPRKKVQLARELGLQPRQVAIWFQNRRARWKSKQIENDFRSLRADYNDLASQFESLQEEKNSLQTQLQKLSELLQEKPHVGNSYNIEDTSYTAATPRSLQEELEQRGITYLYNNQKAGKKWIENQGYDQGLKVTHPILEDKSNNIRYTEEHECRLLNVNGSSESSEKWCDFDSGDSIDIEYQQCNSLQWPNFWG